MLMFHCSLSRELNPPQYSLLRENFQLPSDVFVKQVELNV